MVKLRFRNPTDSGICVLTNKLRDATGASELINSIAGVDQSVEGEVIYTGIAANILARLKVDHIVHRATGGVIDISCLIQDDLYRFRAALRLTLAQEIPGLIYSDGVGTGPDQSASRSAARIDAASSLINTDLFPVGGPLFRPAPRSGGIPAVRKGLTSGEVCKATKEFADLPTLVKRGRAKFHDPEKVQEKGLADKFLPAASYVGTKIVWPVDFSSSDAKDVDPDKLFPFAKMEIRRIALIHADGNGMGKLFQAVEAPDRLRQLSMEIAEATKVAVQVAMRHEELDRIRAEAFPNTKEEGTVAMDRVVMPCRPILLGGDDISLILRADLAFGFACRFLAEFKTRTAEALQQFFPGHEGLTAKLGIILLTPNQPFGAAYRLCEELAKSAKNDGVSQIAFWRLTSSSIPSALSEIENITALADGISLRRKAHDLVQIERLRVLADLLAHDDVGRGALRRVPDLLRQDPVAATRTYVRALQVLKIRNTDLHKKLVDALADFGVNESNPVAEGYCPLWEAHELNQIPKPIKEDGK